MGFLKEFVQKKAAGYARDAKKEKARAAPPPPPPKKKSK